jgi:hypothetical protein
MNPSIVEKRSMTSYMGRRLERLFYTGMAIVVACTVFAGFARTYYLKAYFGAPPLIPLLHLHGAVFTSWVVFFLIQNVLVAANRTRIHRRLGFVGAIIAVLLVIVGVLTAIIRTKQNVALTGDTASLTFLAIPLGDMLLFASLVGAGFYFRRRADVHKRLMLLATVVILDAAVARLPFEFIKAGPPAFFGLIDLFIVACLLYDLITRRRVHSATAWGGLAIVVSQPLRVIIGSTHAWIAFAAWLTRWAA